MKTIAVISFAGEGQSDEPGSQHDYRDSLDLIDNTVTKHGGELVGGVEDGLLAEFSDILDALHFAVSINELFAVDGDNKSVRVGIDLPHEGGSPSSANALARRLDGAGTCISSGVQALITDNEEFISTKLDDESTGSSSSISAFRLGGVSNAAMPIKQQRQQSLPWRSAALVAGLAIVLIVVAAITWQEQFGYDFEPADLTKYEFELPDKASIAVLPFDNLSGDPANDYLGDGLTENIIAVLATSPKLFVIARNSVFTYKNKPTKVQQVAEELGVRYVLEGSVQVQDDRMRVVAQLVDAVDGKHLWAEQYDYDLADIFRVQDDLTYKLLEALHVELSIGNQAIDNFAAWRDDPERLAVFKLAVEGRRAFQQLSALGHTEASRLWGEIFERYPDEPGVNVLMGWLSLQKVILRLATDDDTTIAQARSFADNAVRLSDGQASAEAHILLAELDVFERKHASALTHVEKALLLKPGSALVNHVCGWIKIKSNDAKAGVQLIRTAMRLEPNYSPTIPITLITGLVMLGQFGEAKAIGESLLASSDPDMPLRAFAPAYLAAIAIFENRFPAARSYAEEAMQIDPGLNTRDIHASWLFDILDEDFVERYLDALNSAGIPELPPGG